MISYRVSENGQFTIVSIEGVVKVMMYSLLYLGLFLHKILPAILTEMLCLKKRALVYCFSIYFYTDISTKIVAFISCFNAYSL